MPLGHEPRKDDETRASARRSTATRAVIIGARRWDRMSPNGRWRRPAQNRLHDPEPFWVEGRVRNTHVIATRPRRERSGGRGLVLRAGDSDLVHNRRRPPHLADTAA